MSSSVGTSVVPIPVTLLQYRDISNRPGQEKHGSGNAPSLADSQEEGKESPARYTIEQMEAEVARARAEAAQDVERRLHAEYEQKLGETRESIARAVESFNEKKDDYFTRVETEVIQLSLSIARKILHREAQVDPMLVAALVRLALEKMQEGSNVVIRVATGRGAQWRNCLVGEAALNEVEVVEDAQLMNVDCVVETELGSANFGLDAQLKEVEQGFFDLLALKPGRA